MGHIECNDYGNVFILIDEQDTRSTSERLLNEDVERQTLAIDTLSQKEY